jgi:ABC-type transport system involved in multi-copper enzyme maturation permease subunit
MRLSWVELRRFWSRQLVRAVVIGVIAAIAVAGVVTFVTHSPEGPSAATVEAQVDQQLAQCRQYSGDEWRGWDALGRDPEYQGGAGEYFAQFGSAEEFADEQCQPEYYGGYVGDDRYCLVGLWSEDVSYRQGCPDSEYAQAFSEEPHEVVIGGERLRTQEPGQFGLLPATSVAMLAVAIVVAASFVGGEYRAGTIETSLLWEPRRWRVLGAKYTAAALSLFAIQIGLLVLVVGAMLPAAVWRGSTAGADGEFWRGVALTILRGGLAAALLALLAISVVVVTKHTAAGIAVLLGYAAISPALVNTVLKGLRPYDISENLLAFVRGGEVARWVENGFSSDYVVSHGAPIAMVYVAGYAAVAVVVAGAVFARRDVD